MDPPSPCVTTSADQYSKKYSKEINKQIIYFKINELNHQFRLPRPTKHVKGTWSPRCFFILPDIRCALPTIAGLIQGCCSGRSLHP